MRSYSVAGTWIPLRIKRLCAPVMNSPSPATLQPATAYSFISGPVDPREPAGGHGPERDIEIERGLHLARRRCADPDQADHLNSIVTVPLDLTNHLAGEPPPGQARVPQNNLMSGRRTGYTRVSRRTYSRTILDLRTPPHARTSEQGIRQTPIPLATSRAASGRAPARKEPRR